jgi:hypothetical protein
MGRVVGSGKARPNIGRAVLLPLLVAGLGACGDGGTGPEEPVVSRLEVVAGDAQWAEAGTELADEIVVRAVDAMGNGVGGVAVTWTVTNNGQALPVRSTTAASGEARARWRLGEGGTRHTLVAMVGDEHEVRVRAWPARRVEVSGRVYVLAGEIPGLLRVSILSKAGETSVGVGDDGAFRIEALVAGDTVDYLVDTSESNAIHYPALIRAAGLADPDLRVILVPRRWTIDRGTYTGTTIDLSPDAAFRAPCPDMSDINCDGFYPRAWTTGLKLWPAAAMPIPLAFDSELSTDAITAADSAGFWRIVERMHLDFGSPLFRPARYEELTRIDDGRAVGAVLVRIDNTLKGFGAWANWWWDDAGFILAGVVRPRSTTLLHDLPLMTHELLHTLGFKHTCSWPTVMGGYGCSSHEGLSPTDVAHAHAALAVRARQLEIGAPHGLIAALQGERVVGLGLPPFVAPDAARLRELRMDGIGDFHLGDPLTPAPRP